MYTYEEVEYEGQLEYQVISPAGTVQHWTRSLAEVVAIVHKLNRRRTSYSV